MKKLLFALLVPALFALTGCNPPGTPGGPGATGGSAKQPLIGEANDTFELNPPPLSVGVTQGETKATSIGIKRGKNFDQDVLLKFADLPKGVTIDPASPKIKHGDAEAKFTVKAAEDAAVGDFVIKVTGHPGSGPNASHEFKITVDKK
jgi:uncharacterized membrane protein